MSSTGSGITGGGGYAPAPGGLGPTPNITGERPPQPELVPPPVVVPPPGSVPGIPGTAQEVSQEVKDQLAADAMQQQGGERLSSNAAGQLPTIQNVPLGQLGTGMVGAQGYSKMVARDDKALARDADAAAQADVAAIDAQTKVATAKQEATQRVDEQRLAYQKEQTRQEADYQIKYQQGMSQRLQAMEDVLQKTTSMPFDPNRYMKNRSAGESFLSAIAIGLGSIGNGINGGGNPAQRMLDQAIENDVKGQQVAYERGMDLYKGLNNTYALARQAGQDHETAANTARLANLADYDQQVKVVGGKYGGQQIEAQRQRLLADSMAKSLKIRQEQTNTFHADTLNGLHAQQSARQFDFALGNEDQRRRERQQDYGLRQEALDIKAAGHGGKGPLGIARWNGQAASPEEHKLASKVASTYQTIGSLIQRAKQYRKENSGGTINPLGEQTQKGDTLRQELLLEIKNLGELGALSGPDMGIVEKIMGPAFHGTWASGVTDDRVNAALDELQKYLRQKTNNQMQAYGFTAQPDTDPNTRSVPERAIKGAQ